MSIIFHDFLNLPWEEARGLLREELEGLYRTAQRLQGASAAAVTTEVGTIEGDATPATRYVSNTGTANAPKWATVSLTNGVNGRLQFTHFVQGNASTIVGRRSGSSGNFEELSLGSGLALSGTTLSASLATSDLGTTLTPQFARLGLGTAADASAVGKFQGQFYSPEVSNGNSGTTLTLNFNSGNEHHFTLTGNVTLTLSNPKGGAHYTIVIATGAGGFTVTWPATVKWPGGTPPTITAGAGKVDVIQLVYSAISGNYYGTFAQDY